MKAIVITRYGRPADVLRVKELEKPAPGENRVLVKVCAASLNVSDLAPIKGAFLARLFGTGWRRPKRQILGSDIAGRVEAVGANVTRFGPGDEVFGVAAGGLAEYVCAAMETITFRIHRFFWSPTRFGNQQISIWAMTLSRSSSSR